MKHRSSVRRQMEAREAVDHVMRRRSRDYIDADGRIRPGPAPVEVSERTAGMLRDLAELRDRTVEQVAQESIAFWYAVVMEVGGDNVPDEIKLSFGGNEYTLRMRYI